MEFGQKLGRGLERARLGVDQLLQYQKGRLRISDRLFNSFLAATLMGSFALSAVDSINPNKPNGALLIGIATAVSSGILIWKVFPRLGFRS